MTGEMKSSVMGLILSMVGKPLGRKKEPVAYLYNGVRLPKVPEIPDRWDYPNWAICGPYTLDGYDGVYYKFVATDEAPVPGGYIGKDEGAIGYSVNFCSSGLATTDELVVGLYEYETGAKLNYGMNSWGKLKGLTITNWFGPPAKSEKFLWTNTDILNEDDSVFLAASDPIPVYE